MPANLPTDFDDAAAVGPLEVAMVGASFRSVGFDRLAAMTLPNADLGAFARACGAGELVYLATCNRVELYVAAPTAAVAALSQRAAAFFSAGGRAPVLPEELALYRGREAVAHLFSVAASLQSLALGECEILGQVRRAADQARQAGTLGARLDKLFREAGRVAALVRQETAIGKTPVSIASLASRAIREHFGGSTIERAVLIGVGDMTRKVAQTLKGKAELLFVNRTTSRAEELAEALGGRAVALDAFRRDPPRWLDVLVTATSAPDPVVTRAELRPALEARAQSASARPLFVCDLGLPPDVAADATETASGSARRVVLADLERIAIENQRALAGEAARAHDLVERHAGRFARRLSLRDEAERSLEALLQERLAHLGPEDRDALRRFTGRLADRFAAVDPTP